MLISVQYLIDRLHKPKRRADEVYALRKRLLAQPEKHAVGTEEGALADELAELRRRLSEEIGEVQACRTCAKGHPLPHGAFAGGHCCGLNTTDAFNDDELAALRLSGVVPAHLKMPSGTQAGCAFRGETGCSLQTNHRPNLCLRYVCPDLSRELFARGDGTLDRIEALGSQLETAYLAFIQRRADRIEHEQAAQDLAATAAPGVRTESRG